MLSALLATARLAAALTAVDTAPAREAALHGMLAVSPDAHVVRSAGGTVALATRLLVPMRSADAETAARLFLAEHGPALGVAPTDTLVLRKGVLPGHSGPVIFERMVRGLTVFGGHVSVGLGGSGEISSASSSGPLPSAIVPFQIDEAAARSVAAERIRGEVVSIVAGWSLEAAALRPAFVAHVVQRQPYRSFRVVVDGATGRAAHAAFPLLRYKNQAKLYRLSPSKPYSLGATPGACPVTTDSSGNKKVDTCAPAEVVTLQGLSGNGTLTGNPGAHQGRTSVYNCKGGTDYTTSACTQTFKADSNGDFLPANLTDYGTSTTDPMSELQAYYFVDLHSRFMDSLDPSFAGLPLIPGFTNAYGPSELGLGGSGALDNAFFDPANKMMVFGQGSSVDFAYDGEVVFHEMTHAASSAIGDTLHQPDVLFPVAGPNGLFMDPLSINEGNADTFSFMEPGVNDPYLAEFDARDEISVLISKIPIGPNGYIRDEGPDFLKTCQGDGVASNAGRTGEPHDDGEVWAEFSYEAFQGLKPIPVPAGATYTSVATPAMFKALEQLVALPTAQQTYSAYANLFESQVRTQHGKAAGDYVECVKNRHELSGCDGQTVTIYSGEKPYNDQYAKNAWKAFYFSKADVYTDPKTGSVNVPAGFDGVPGAFQWKLHVPAGATGLKLTVCDATPALLSSGGTGKLHVSFGKPVSYGVTGSGATADWTYPAKGSWTISYKDCASVLGTPHPTVATISGSTCDNCANSSGDDGHALAAGDWYFLVANTGGAASFASLNAEILGTTAPSRPAPVHSTCTLSAVDFPDGGTDGGTVVVDGGSDGGGGTGGTDGGTGGTDGGTGGTTGGGTGGTTGDAGTTDGGGVILADGGLSCPAGTHELEHQCVTSVSYGGCGASGSGVGVLSLFGLCALVLRRRRLV